MEIVPFLIEMRVGVSDGRMAVGGIGVSVVAEETGVKVDGEDAAVGKTSNENVQASSDSMVSIKQIISDNHLCCFISFSLSVLAYMMELGKTYYPRRNVSRVFQTRNDYKTFVHNCLFPYRIVSGEIEHGLKLSVHLFDILLP